MGDTITAVGTVGVIEGIEHANMVFSFLDFIPNGDTIKLIIQGVVAAVGLFRMLRNRKNKLKTK